MSKTIFITIFQGLEAKNILRTGILTNLLKVPNLRIVFFVKSRERARYYEEEFQDPRIIYEVAPMPPLQGLDWFLGKLKFTLLKTPTTDLKRRFILESNKNYLAYYCRSFINLLMARPLGRRIARALDYWLVKNDIYAPYFDKYKPDLVFLAHLFDESEIHLLRAAKKRKIKTVGFINSWDKVTARCILRILPDKCVVFNDIVKRELMKHDEVAEADIFVSGIPHYDHYFNEERSSRSDFFRKIKISPQKKLIVYASAGRAQSEADLEMIALLTELLKQGELGRQADLLVRFQPNDFIDAKELATRLKVAYDYPGIRFSEKRGVDWDMNFDDLKHLKDTLYHMSALISYTSSMCIDAAIFDKPVININFELHPNAPAHKLPTRYFKVDHYQNVLRTGGVRLVGNREELTHWLKRYLANSSLDQAGRRKLVLEQCQYTDGRAGQRIADFLISQMMT